MFVSLGASLNGFTMGCRKVLFVHKAHLSGPYKGTLLVAIALDADDHLFDVASSVVGKEDKEERYWFLSVLSECLGGLKLVIMSDRHDGLLYVVPRVLGAENHNYCLRHLWENFVKTNAKHGVCSNSCKDLMKKMFSRVAYAPTRLVYDVAVEELRAYKALLATRVEDNGSK